MSGARVLVHTGDGIVAAGEARVPILDHGFLFGDSVYEVVRTGNGRPFLLKEHLDRMRRSGGLIYFELPWSNAEIEARMRAVHEALGVAEAYFRIIATRGPGPISLLPDGCDEPGLYVVGRELMRYPEKHYREGCHLAVVRRLRNDPRSLDPRAKTGNYLNNMLGMVEARRAGADDALFLNVEGHVTECTTSNIWLVRDGVVITPPLGEGLLEGITRAWLFETLPAQGIEVREEVLGREDLDAMDEVFCSGTVKGIMPVARIDGAPVGPGRPGKVTRRAEALYAEALARN